MPSEIRYITFSGDEFLDAARVYFKRLREALPGPLLSVVLRNDCEVKLLLGRTDDETATEITLDHNKVGSILVFYCINNKIPLPANSRRTLKVIDGNICLMVTKNIPIADLDRIAAEIPNGRSA